MGPKPDTAAAPAMAVGSSSKASPLRLLTASSPTSHNMLLFRTLNQELGHPNANADTLAPLLRDKLMPARMWWLKHMPGAMKMLVRGLEDKRLGVPGVLNFVDARTSWFDAVVKEAVTNHGIRQVVVVAAGFDTRAYRIGAQHKGVNFFEVDLPHASKKKQGLVQELLQPEASFPRPTFLAADLSTTPLDAVLLNPASSFSTTTTNNNTVGNNSSTAASPADSATADEAGPGQTSVKPRFDPTLPTLFTVEGLIYYLPEEAVRALFRSMLRIAAPGSRVAFDFLHKEVLEGAVPLPPAYKVTAASVANKGEPFISGIQQSREAVQAFLQSASPATPDAAAAAAGVDAAAAAAAAGGGKGVCWRVVDFMGPKEAVSRQLRHLEWNDALPPILSFYSFAAAEVVTAE